MKTIVGAGLSGLIAAHAWPNAHIMEVAHQPAQAHKALLRFRSNVVAELTGIEFREVQVRKGIWSDGRFVQPSIGAANAYAYKCHGSLVPERSIWSIDPVKRWVAPEDFYWSLLDAVKHRTSWGALANPLDPTLGPMVSTAPLAHTAVQLGMNLDGHQFRRQPIAVNRFRVPGADVHQTVYFPDLSTSVYRASITGDLLIVERVGGAAVQSHIPDDSPVWSAFGLGSLDVEPLDDAQQSYGKIAPLKDDAWRKQLLFEMTHKHGVYSLGRFATWRNILLDDVVSDIAVIKRLHRSYSAYDHRKQVG